MLICNKCNKEYTQSLKFCPTCGSELNELTNDTPSKMDIATNSDSENEGNFSNIQTKEKKCINCGANIVDGDRFCIMCGKPVKENAIQNDSEDASHFEEKHVSSKTLLQDALNNVFNSNKFLNFFWKYAIIFTLYYPIYLLMERIDGLYGLVNVLDYISIPTFYAFYIGLIALWSKKNYLPMLIAFAIRFLNSFILLFQTEVPISSVFRIAVLVTAFVFIFKDFRTTGQYQNIKSNFDAKTCPACGASVKANDKFCSKCGENMEK